MSGRIEETLFRRTANGREALAPAGETSGHVHYQPVRRAGIGTITSTSKKPFTFYQYLAFELAGGGDPSKAIVPFCTVTQAMQLHADGKIQ